MAVGIAVMVGCCIEMSLRRERIPSGSAPARRGGTGPVATAPRLHFYRLAFSMQRRETPSLEWSGMDTTSSYTLSAELAHVLKEAFAGAPGPWTYFTDNRPGVGMLATIENLTAEEASVATGPERATIAGHVNHVRASLAGSSALLERRSSSRDRTGTWEVARVSDPEWKQLQLDLRVQYDRSLQLIQNRLDWDEDAFGAALGAIAHAAYHLGSIRQRLLSAGMLRT